MKRQNLLLSVALTALLLGAGCAQQATTSSDTKNATPSNAPTAPAPTITYSGQDGKNALVLLQAHHQVDASSQGFVNVIDGIKPSDHQFWAFYVNGKQAEVGAKDYQTKNGDAIEWKLETY